MSAGLNMNKNPFAINFGKLPVQYIDRAIMITLIAERYSSIFGISREKAMDLAIITRGYPFAYQALGKYLWESKDHVMDEGVLFKLDEALRHYVYEKIWSEMSEKDKWFMSFIVKKSDDNR